MLRTALPCLSLPLAVLQCLTALAGSTLVALSRPEPSTPPASAAPLGPFPSVSTDPAPPRALLSIGLPAARHLTSPSVPRRAPRPTATQPARKDDPPLLRRTRMVLREALALSPEEQLQTALDRLPGYRPGEAEFVITPGLGYWSMTNLATGRVYVSSSVPADRVYDVVAHEWSHVVSLRTYNGDVRKSVRAMKKHFGGKGMLGAERAADCMARELGAQWTFYTACEDKHWQAAAQKLLTRHPL